MKFLQVKSTILFSLLLFLTTIVYAQTPQKPVTIPPPLLLREISGIVKDTLDYGIPGTTVRLSSEKDTLVTSTNGDGIFVFKNVKSATYTLSITSLGFRAIVVKFKQNDAVPRIVMDPIILKEAPANTLNEVVINGTPSIIYKTDTVEYKASDYIVRENATIDELLKKMEGMEVGTDGTLVHQGAAVTKAKINGKTYSGGDVATAIQNLPAEIVDKIQVVDDYGDQAARTGIKDGDPEKILNIVTRADKSVGNTANIRAGAGNNERYEGSVFGTRLNKNQTISVNALINNTVNGVTNSGSNGADGGGGGRGGNGGGGGNNNSGGGASGGTTNTGNSSFSFRDQLSKAVKINTNYRYTFNNRNAINSSVSQIFSSLGTTNSVNESSNDNNTKNHNFSFELEADLDSNNFLRVSPTVSYQSTESINQSEIMRTGLIHQDQRNSSKNTNTRPTLGATVFYQHIFAKPRRNFSFQLSLNNNNQDIEQEQNNNIVDYQPDGTLVNELTNRLIKRENLTKNYRASFTFAEPLTPNTQLEFNGQINYNGYDNTATTSNINAGGNFQLVDSLSNIYDYSFTQTRLALNYRYGLSTSSKVRFSVGVTAVPALLKGTKISLGTSTNRSSFNVIPIARFQYLWSRQHSIQVNYSGNAQEPSFDQIQPVRDVSNPQNPIVGNPNLKVTFNHSITTNYNNYIANSKLNYSVNGTASFIDNAVVRNTVQFRDAKNIQRNETRYVNMNGNYRFNGNYSISKQLANRKYNLSLSGNLQYNHNLSMSNNIINTTTSWSMIERFGPRINPNEWLEVNPYVSYLVAKSQNTLLPTNNSKTNTLAFSVEGKFYMWKTLNFGYSLSKNYVSGINANVTNNPFVINSYIQKEMWKRRATVTLQAFDILNQNNFINREITDNGITDTRTNALSRYFMLRVSMRLQKWSGARGRNNTQPQRRGDGSFMN